MAIAIAVLLLAIMTHGAAAQSKAPMFPGNPVAEELAKALVEAAGMGAVRNAGLTVLNAEMQKREREWAEYSKSLWQK